MGRWWIRSVLVLFAAVGTPLLVHSQSPQPSDRKAPAFEVASIKPGNPSIAPPGRLVSVNVVTTPGRLIARNESLRELIRDAYSLDDYQVFGGPTWMASTRFDVQAKAVGSPNRRQLLLMLQTLLTERFKLAVHRDSKELSIYALVVDKNGPKFHALEAAEQACYPSCEDHPSPLNRLRQSDVPSLARYLTRLGADRPVIDKTGLIGTFRIELDMQKIMAAALEGGGPPSNEHIYRASIDAVQDELGLKLIPMKSPLDVLVIDHVEKPTPD
jgi:uncharacterized protein (TIGR03435 family)